MQDIIRSKNEINSYKSINSYNLSSANDFFMRYLPELYS